jgi:TolB protein
MDADGQNLRRLTQDTFVDRDPHWSPVENVIVFTSDRDSPGFTEIYALTLPEDGSDPVITRLTDAGNNSYSASWADDGTMIVFASDRGGTSDVYTMDRNGENEILITSNDGNAENREPDFSPDRRWIAFVSNRDGLFQTYVTNAAGTEVQRVTNSEREDFSVVFRPLARNQ